MSTVEHILLPVLDDLSGRQISQEMIEVSVLEPGRVRLIHSPAFVDGIAWADVIDLDPSLPHGYRVVQRGGYLAVVLVFADNDAKGPGTLADLTSLLDLLGGVCDGGPSRTLVCSVPARAGFPAVEAAMASYCGQRPGTTWWFGNVYTRAGDPIGWW